MFNKRQIEFVRSCLNTPTDILMFYHIRQENNNVQVETLFDQVV